jgi:uncharacterized protein (DUF1697 family)
MSSFITLLRGINVSGHNMIKMAELKALYESLGFRDVTTYIQSGNVVFQTEKASNDLVEASIEKAIEKKFGFQVPVIARKPGELAKVIRANPFAGRRGVDESKLYVTFLKTKPAPAVVKALPSAASRSTDQYHIAGNEIYLYCPDGYGRTLLNNTFFEKQVKLMATTRNWKTVNTLYVMASNPGK